MDKRNDLPNYFPCLLIINFMLLKESDRFQALSRQSICLKINFRAKIDLNWSKMSTFLYKIKYNRVFSRILVKTRAFTM